MGTTIDRQTPRGSPNTSTRPTWRLKLAIILGSALLAWASVRAWRTSSVASGQPASLSKVASRPRSIAGFEPTRVSDRKPSPSAAEAEGMAWIPGGEFSMGCVDPRDLPHGGRDPMSDARPIHRVRVDGFWMDRTEVTNDQYAAFVKATGYRTVAERTPTLDEFPDAPPENLVVGSTVFTPPRGPVPLDTHYRWWSYVKGADWRHPEGPRSNLEGRGAFPVVHVAYEDAESYAKWLDKRLPTESEWEFAARGGRTGEPYAWGVDLCPESKWMANTWQGQFPVNDAGDDGFAGLGPVAKFPPNGYGLHDMAGNVWEWCSDWYRPDTYASLLADGKVADNPRGPATSHDPLDPGQPKRVHRGGSFLCTEQYCVRYMIGTRGKGEVRTSSNHLGFRCVKPADGARVEQEKRP